MATSVHQTVFGNECSSVSKDAARGRVVLEEIPANVAVISDDLIILKEDCSIGQCVASLLLLAGATAGVLYIGHVEFLATGIKIGAWVALLAFGLGMVVGPLWRKQITIDLARGDVIVGRGPLLLIFTKCIGLKEFDAFTVETSRATVAKKSNRDSSRNCYLVGKLYLLIGKTRLTLLSRTFEAKDAEADRLARAIENRLRAALAGRLGERTQS